MYRGPVFTRTPGGGTVGSLGLWFCVPCPLSAVTPFVVSYYSFGIIVYIIVVFSVRCYIMVLLSDCFEPHFQQSPSEL